MEQNNEKQLTKYDRKLLAKEAAVKREKRNQKLYALAAAAIVLVILALIILVPMTKRKKELSEYIKVNDTSISKLEFNYYKTNVINNYASILPYLLDTSVPYDQQIYNKENGMTWDDFFNNQAAQAILENKATIADAKATNFTYDITESYNTYLSSMQTAAASAGMKLDTYLASIFGSAASEKTLKSIVEDDLLSYAYYDHLTEQMTPSDEEVQATYDEDPSLYDSVDYHMMSFSAEVMEGAAEEEVSAAMGVANAKAQEMLDRLNAGEDFEALCAEYAPADEKADYEDTETEHSLKTNLLKSNSSLSYTDWLFEDRTEGDTTLYTDEENSTVYVLKFDKRYMGENVLSDIKSDATQTAVAEYISALTEKLTLSDPNGYLPFFVSETIAE